MTIVYFIRDIQIRVRNIFLPTLYLNDGKEGKKFRSFSEAEKADRELLSFRGVKLADLAALEA
jgi:hypothetical protein